jgi:ankyrin repeat protein
MQKDSDGEQMKTRQADGCNALMLAAFYGKTDVVNSLISYDSVKKELRTVTMMGVNALALAALKGHKDIVNLLFPLM